MIASLDSKEFGGGGIVDPAETIARTLANLCLNVSRLANALDLPWSCSFSSKGSTGVESRLLGDNGFASLASCRFNPGSMIPPIDLPFN